MEYKEWFHKLTNKRIDLIILTVVAVGFFLSSLILSFGLPKIFISPDETANYFFTEQFVEYSRLYQFEPLNVSFNDMVFPRSIVSLEGRLVPVSFIGLSLLYGFIGKLIGAGATVLFTPLLAVLALFAWRSVLEKLFSRNLALMATLVLVFHPAWWYYTARSMMHNVLFVSLLMFATYFLFVKPIKIKSKITERIDLYHQLNIAFGAIALALAFWVRTSEIFWVMPILAVQIVWFIKKIKPMDLVIFFVTLVLCLLPLLAHNNALYGDPFTVGYTAETGAGFDTVVEAEVEESDSILPFEFSEKAVARHSVYYGLGLFWWISILVVIGLFVLIGNRIEDFRPKYKRGRYAYHVVFFVTGGLLALAYGGWTFTDNPDPNSVTIANSYVRYWLPVFVLSTVYAAGTINWLGKKTPTDLTYKILVTSLIVLIAGLGIRSTFFVPDDGLFAIRTTLERNFEIKEAVLELTESDSIIIVDRADKIFFPDRAVVYPLRAESTYDLMPRILLRNNLYYYGITFPESDLEYLNTKKLFELGLYIQIIEIFDEESLYRIYEINE